MCDHKLDTNLVICVLNFKQQWNSYILELNYG